MIVYLLFSDLPGTTTVLQMHRKNYLYFISSAVDQNVLDIIIIIITIVRNLEQITHTFSSVVT